MSIIDISNLQKAYGSTALLDGVTFTIEEEAKVGFVGMNGCGKSTLFKIVAGLETKDSGNISFKKGASVGYLAQDPYLDESKTINEEIESALKAIREKVSRYDRLNELLSSASEIDSQKLLEEHGEIHSWLEHHGGWNTDYRIETVLTHLKIKDKNQPISVLSGGWRKRVAMAKLILQSPDLLLLDEPTNHLDAETTEWLEGYLKSYPGALMLITHDRYFLDNVVKQMFELEKGKITCYSGGYSNYLIAKGDRLLQEDRVQTRLLNLFRREEEWMSRGPKARSTKQKARIDRFNELEEKTKTSVQKGLNLEFQMDQRLGGTILEIVYLTKSFSGRQIFKPFSLSMKQGDRIGIIGANGSGKTTFLKIILGQEHATSGSITLGKNTKISYFDQERSVLDPEMRVEEALGEGYWVTIGGEKRHKTGYLEEFLFEKHDHRKPIKTLSGGERARLIMAKMMLEGCNMLILDEPTNDLDIPTLQLLDEALTSFPGCILMVTHDRFFLDKVATGILSFEDNGEVVFYEGNYEIYKTLKAQKQWSVVSGQRSVVGANGRLPEKKTEETTPKKEKKGLSYKENLELEEIERAIESLEARKLEVEAILANPAEYANYPEKLKETGEEFGRIEHELSGLMKRWEELEMKKQF